MISTINGDSNVPFYKEFGNQGLRAEDAPIMAFQRRRRRAAGHGHQRPRGALGRLELLPERRHPAEQEIRGQLPRPIVRRTTLPDGENRVTDDPIEAAYFGVYVWKQAVEKGEIDRRRQGTDSCLWAEVPGPGRGNHDGLL